MKVQRSELQKAVTILNRLTRRSTLPPAYRIRGAKLEVGNGESQGSHDLGVESSIELACIPVVAIETFLRGDGADTVEFLLEGKKMWISCKGSRLSTQLMEQHVVPFVVRETEPDWIELGPEQTSEALRGGGIWCSTKNAHTDFRYVQLLPCEGGFIVGSTDRRNVALFKVDGRGLGPDPILIQESTADLIAAIEGELKVAIEERRISIKSGKFEGSAALGRVDKNTIPDWFITKFNQVPFLCEVNREGLMGIASQAAAAHSALHAVAPNITIRFSKTGLVVKMTNPEQVFEASMECKGAGEVEGVYNALELAKMLDSIPGETVRVFTEQDMACPTVFKGAGDFPMLACTKITLK